MDQIQLVKMAELSCPPCKPHKLSLFYVDILDMTIMSWIFCPPHIQVSHPKLYVWEIHTIDPKTPLVKSDIC